MNSRSAAKRNQTRRVLVVEDDADLMRLLEEFLVLNAYEVLRARNGVEAMVALTAPERESPHVILLDLGLPLESGVSVLAFLRQVMQSGVPVVVLTGRDDPEEEAAVRALGVSAYLRKPAPAGTVLAALSRALA